MTRPTLLLSLLTAGLLLGACKDFEPGSGSRSGDNSHLQGSVHAIGLVHEDGAGHSVADLVTIRVVDGSARYLEGVYQPQLVLGDDTLPFIGTSAGGVFGSDSRRGGWSVSAGGLVRFQFNHVDLEGRHSEFEGVVEAPGTRHLVDLAPEHLVLYAGDPVTLNLTGIQDGVWIRVVRTDGIEQRTFSTFNLGGPGEIALALDSLRGLARNEIVVPGNAFPTPGVYRIEVINFALVDRSNARQITGNHGDFSFYGAGLLVALEVEIL